MNNEDEDNYQPEFKLVRSNAMDLTDETFNFQQFEANNAIFNNSLDNLVNTFNNINTNSTVSTNS
jgi:hypothetical protein